MRQLELLAPARNAEIGIAAIDCGADAVYIAGPDFGARKAAGNPVEDIAGLCGYAHRYGARIFVTFNIALRDEELEEVHRQMLLAQEAGADAFIIRDIRTAGWKDITVPLHASTQCAIRDVETARRYEAAGCSRIVLERQLSLDTVKEICGAVGCEVEFFVHGALCVCYSGECRLSEWLDGRSGDRGDCVQACRSLYDLVDGDGRTIVRNKALLSLKDYRLKERLLDLAEAGVTSFKIEGRLKNESYVRNVVRDYAIALDRIVEAHPDEYCRASFGHVSGGFAPDTDKTFNRGYTTLFLDGKRGRWACSDAPKSMGEYIGKAGGIRRRDARTAEITVIPATKGLELHNGDGFAFTSGGRVTGFRGDDCEGCRILCKPVPGLKPGMALYRNVSAAFEKEIGASACKREIGVELDVTVKGSYDIDITARTEDGREVYSPFKTDLDTAENKERAEAMIREQLSKRCGHYSFKLGSLTVETPGGRLPMLSASTLNGIRRAVAGDIDGIPCRMMPMACASRPEGASAGGDGDREGAGAASGSFPLPMDPLMKSRYCIRFELGMCPVHQGAAPSGPLFLVNNGRRLGLEFDCASCEMKVTRDRSLR